MWRRAEKRSRTTVRAGLTVALVCALLASVNTAADRLLTASLGRWLDNDAAPKLARMLSKHPMFKGETIRIVAMEDGRPVSESNRLIHAIEDALTRRLLQTEGVRIAWQDGGRTCEVPQAVNFLLGVEIDRHGQHDHRLNLAMVDLAESVWVSGANLTWEGRLSTAERRALDAPETSAIAGSMENPLRATDVDAIAKLLKSRLQCTLPEGLDGGVYVATPAHGDLIRITRGVERELSISPMANLTRTRSAAEWVMALEVEPMGQATSELVVTLAGASEDAPRQRAASIFVTGLAERPAAEPDRPEPASELLSRIRHTGRCAKARHGRCVEVEFELHQGAYLAVFHTRAGAVGVARCSEQVERYAPGHHTYEVRLPDAVDATQRAEVGVYAVATRSRSVARAFQRLLRTAPGACSGGHAASSTWLANLERLIDSHGPDVHWQALHLVNTSSGFAGL